MFRAGSSSWRWRSASTWPRPSAWQRKRGCGSFDRQTAGIFGATAAVGRLAGLDDVQLKNALGLAYAQNAGTMQSHIEGGPALALQMGFAAGAAVRAVGLTRAGLPGPHDVLEGPFGYFTSIRRRVGPGTGVG